MAAAGIIAVVVAIYVVRDGLGPPASRANSVVLRALRLHPGWMTDLDDLLNLPRPKWGHREIAILGGPLEDDLAIALGT